MSVPVNTQTPVNPVQSASIPESCSRPKSPVTHGLSTMSSIDTHKTDLEMAQLLNVANLHVTDRKVTSGTTTNTEPPQTFTTSELLQQGLIKVTTETEQSEEKIQVEKVFEEITSKGQVIELSQTKDEITNVGQPVINQQVEQVQAAIIKETETVLVPKTVITTTTETLKFDSDVVVAETKNV
ncbi:MAG: hypothetical protein JHC93_05530 [Parachlamydiales bacterium]|nr:hypothetical protein [Parachlamydiales bacterium]